MKREILCQSCATAAPRGKDLSYDALLQRIVNPPEHTRRVAGKALREMKCDHCNVTIIPGDKAVGVSTWNSGRYFSWEVDYLRLEA